MYKCNCCGEIFDEPRYYREYHGQHDLCPEVWAICPECGETDFDEYEEGDMEDEEE